MTNNEDSVDETKTCDMYQTACLMAIGCRLKKYNYEKGRVYFYFDNDGDLVPRLKQEYLAGQLEVNAVTFVDKIRSLKSLCAEVTNRAKRNHP